MAQCLKRADVALDEHGQIAVTGLGCDPLYGTPARVAVVACRARREWAVIRSAGSPEASARAVSIRVIVLPLSGSAWIPVP